MARFDVATEAFMNKVAEDAPHEHLGAKDALSLARKTINFTQDPKRATSRLLVGLATKELLKEGSIGVFRLYDMLNDSYQKDWWHWEPETIWQTLHREHGLELDRELRDLVLSLQAVVTTNLPFESWNVFEKVTAALNHNPVDFQILQPPEVDEVAFTVAVLRHIRGETVGYEDEVLGYMAACARSSGIVYLPKELYPERAQDFLDNLNNDLELRDKVKAKKDDGSAAYKIQTMQLKEVADYVFEQRKGVT